MTQGLDLRVRFIICIVKFWGPWYIFLHFQGLSNLAQALDNLDKIGRNTHGGNVTAGAGTLDN
jgi:hypothetical protein